jgi:hypothetical protein
MKNKVLSKIVPKYVPVHGFPVLVGFLVAVI